MQLPFKVQAIYRSARRVWDALLECSTTRCVDYPKPKAANSYGEISGLRLNADKFALKLL